MIQENCAPTASLYNELPYPADGVMRTTIARILKAGLRKHAPELLSQKTLRIADIGCGTGEVSVGIAHSFPQALVTAVDINPPSLALARELTARHRVNMTVAQCDITNDLRGPLQETGGDASNLFDVVVSVGVLHHLADPAVGFAEIRRIIRPDGLFLCYLYSRHGRREEMAIKAMLTEALPPGSDFHARAQAMHLLGLSDRRRLTSVLKMLRWRLKFGPPVVPMELIKVFFRRRHLTHLSDTVSNPCEHLYSFGEIKRLASDTGWSFVDVAEDAGLPTKLESHTRDPHKLKLLKQMPEDARLDYFAFYYRTEGFMFFLRPR